MNFENIKTAKDYETLLAQFNALKAIAISQQAKLEHYQKTIQKFSFERVYQLEAELESQKEMNAILTEELETKNKQQ
jgi:hypothetical protein